MIDDLQKKSIYHITSYNNYKKKIYLFFKNIIMETSLYLASIFGPLMFVIWISLVVNSWMYQKMINSFLQEWLALYISSLAWFIVWLLLVQTHNIWELSWVLIITILSWIILVKSTLLLIIPSIFEKIVKKMKFSNTMIIIAWIFYVLVWLFLSFKAFM